MDCVAMTSERNYLVREQEILPAGRLHIYSTKMDAMASSEVAGERPDGGVEITRICHTSSGNVMYSIYAGSLRMFKNHIDYPPHALDEFIRQLNAAISAQLKLLLEEKHLYQKFTIDPNKIKADILKHVLSDHREEAENLINEAMNNNLSLCTGTAVLIAPRGGEPHSVPSLILPNARVMCNACGERNVFKPVSYQDATNELLKRSFHGEEAGVNFDVVGSRLYFVAYQCQHCEGAPIGFLIRKEGWRFSLDGRSPMKEIDVPGYLPRKESNLYRDALISWTAGKQLAAVFYLRAFIEQFARRQTGMKGRETGDEIMEKYSAKLPANHSDEIPSLREWYRKLSVPIHSADEAAAEALFETAQREIGRHFDIRRVFKIAER